MSRKGASPVTIWATIALLLLAAQGAALRALAEAPYSFSNPGPGRSVGLLPPEVERAAPWSDIVQTLEKRQPNADLGALAREAAGHSDAVLRAYAHLLAVLTPSQRAAIERPRTDLVDPLFPGMNGDTRPLADFCLAALGAPNTPPPPSTEASDRDTGDAADTPMPQVILWGITRLALCPGPDALTPEQKTTLAPLVAEAAAQAEAWHRSRAALAQKLGMPPLEAPRPIVALPAPQALHQVRKALTDWVQAR